MVRLLAELRNLVLQLVRPLTRRNLIVPGQVTQQSRQPETVREWFADLGEYGDELLVHLLLGQPHAAVHPPGRPNRAHFGGVAALSAVACAGVVLPSSTRLAARTPARGRAPPRFSLGCQWRSKSLTKAIASAVVALSQVRLRARWRWCNGRRAGRSRHTAGRSAEP